MKKIAIVGATFYQEIFDEMLNGVKEVLTEKQIDFDLYTVPGVFEIPAAVNFLIDSPYSYDGYVALGCVIRGETTHYDYVCVESARGLQDLALQKKLALGYGVLTCENKDQAWARAKRDQKNKGAEVAKACIAMMNLKNALLVK